MILANTLKYNYGKSPWYTPVSMETVHNLPWFNFTQHFVPTGTTLHNTLFLLKRSLHNTLFLLKLLYTTLCFYRNYFTQHFVDVEWTLYLEKILRQKSRLGIKVSQEVKLLTYGFRDKKSEEESVVQLKCTDGPTI